jgi:hypothetical protein
MIEAILYVEFAEGIPVTEDRLMISLMNCKQLTYNLPNGVIVHILCNDPESLNQAISQDFACVEGVKRITICVVNRMM